MSPVLRSLIFFSPLLVACSSDLKAVDNDGDGFTADVDCWDGAEGPPESGLTGADFNPDAVDVPYDGFDTNCDGSDDFDLDGDGYVTDAAYIGRATYGVVDSGTATAAGDCWDDPGTTPEEFVALNGFPQLDAATINPGAVSDTWYDGIDQNCGGEDDFDADGDGFATAAYPDRSGTPGDDCFDLDESGYTGFDPADVNPDADEVCGDNVDTDCDSLVDADDPDAEAVTWFTDSDGDLFGDASATIENGLAVVACEQPSGFVLDSTDCDDAETTTFPGAAPTDDATACMKDTDDDGYGDTNVSGAVTAGTDCDDDVSSTYPGATEVVDDSVDQDCDTEELCYADADDDGYRTSATIASTDLDCTDDGEGAAGDPDGDCDDTSATTYPGVALSDSLSDCMKDDDADGYGDSGPPSGVTAGTDCDDVDPTINPAGVELAGDEVDQDCTNTEICYTDADNDGYRPNATSTVTSADTDCTDSGEARATEPTTDCLDSDANTFPGAASIDSTSSCMTDADGDNYGDSSPVSGVTAGTDCNDGDSAIRPSATELAGDNVDQNCDNKELCYYDTDNDGYRLTTTFTSSDADCNDSGEAVSTDPTTDCLDTDANTFPGAASTDSTTSCMTDADGDNYGDISPVSGVTAGTDCNDSDSAIRPSATEITGDEVDQNCDNKEVCYVDADNDGYRLTTTITSSDVDCTDSGEAVSSDPATDCLDSDANTFPGAASIESTSLCMTDADGDNYGDSSPVSGVTAGTDCNDSDSAIRPSATEIAGDNVDQNCDSQELCYYDTDNDGYRLTTTFTSSDADCNDSGEAVSSDPATDCLDSDANTFPGAASIESTSLCMTDSDGDNYGSSSPVSGVTAGTDCNDSDSAIRPLATELAGDNVDQNCDSQELCYYDTDNDGYRLTTTFTSSDADCNDSGEAVSSDPTGECLDTDANTFPGAASTDSTTSCMTDADGDNYGDISPVSGVTAGTDCNDSVSTINPGAAEVVADGTDQNCDSKEICYTNVDGDSYRTSSTTTSSDADCADAGEALSSVLSGDCDDSDANTFPGAASIESTSLCMTDVDGDNYGDDSPGTGVTAGTDCNDSVSTINPGATEVVADGIDQTCDGQETCYQNMDGDSYRTSSTVTSSDADCVDVGEALSSVASGDCDDNDADTFPGAASIESTTICMTDADGDNYGDSSPAGGVTAGTDCDDGEADTNPGIIEEFGSAYCDDGIVDNDCDLVLECSIGDEDLADADIEYLGVALNNSAGSALSWGDLSSGTDLDVLVGANGADTVYMVAGPLTTAGSLTLSSATYELTDSVSGSSLGWALSRVGDVDGDGHGDVLVGAYLDDVTTTNSGAAYLVSGPITGDMVLDTDAGVYTLSSGTAQTRVGYAVDLIADQEGLTDDGYADLLVGAIQARSGPTAVGGAYILHDLTADADLSSALNYDTFLYGPSLSSYAGAAVSSAGDVDADGRGDILVGAYAYSGNTGRAFLLYGPVSTGDIALSTSDAVYTAEDTGNYAGWAVADLGDLDGDGDDEFAISSINADNNGGTAAGRVYIFSGSTTRLTSGDLGTAPTILDGAVALDEFGSSIASGDVDGDGNLDVIVGASKADGGGGSSGETYIFYGPVTGSLYDTGDAVTLTGESGSRSGYAVRGGMDINGDSFDDVLVGAIQEGTSASKAGAAYLLLGGAE